MTQWEELKQNFPISKSHSHACVIATTDWSWKSRKLLSGMKKAAGPAQTKNYTLLWAYRSITSNYPEHYNILQETCKIQQQQPFNHNLETSIDGCSPLLKQLLTNAMANIDK